MVLSAAAHTGVPDVLRGLVRVIDGDRVASDEAAEAEAWHP
jgi:hypothetical protein